MSMFRCSCLVALLALPVAAQPPQGGRPTGRAPAARQDGSAEQMFFRAFYLARGERRYQQALELYRRFLAAAPDHRYARRAATEALSLLNRLGRHDEATKFRQKYAGLLGPRAGDRRVADRPRRPGGRGGKAGDRRRPPGAGRPEGADPELARRLEELRKRLAQAEKEGDQETAARLRRQIARAERAMRGGGAGRPQRGRGFGGRGGGFRMNLAEMTDEQAEQFLERMGRFTDRMAQRLEDDGETERAKELKANWEKIRKLVGEGKKAEAQKVLEELRRQMFRRRR